MELILTLESKQKAKQACLFKLGKQIEVYQIQLKQLQQDLNNETKSSAGDKYETGRAMLHIEREKIGRQLHELEQLQSLLLTINEQQQHQKAQQGSLVLTKNNLYFISVSLGKISTEDFNFYAISNNTPMAQAMLGCSSGENFVFREVSYQILGIV